ncbi:uncharacterized protein LOC111267397 [Varroa jacobsoni]|uniref:G-protein coupled receptors family 1 profile domain-containing protein n=1 Tax=Varroa destructor TaxID=109461 RepID=A0A7M7J656_VARDE|nr:uncharacterized protein LOC111244475 [Varroa destructor]XP_022701368.1 uncharacterized protein LOC111267397 [Varroa jacobsoni]
MEDLDPTEDDEFWESNSSHWCGWSCRYTVAPALAVGAVVNAALACVLARRKLPLSANELFMLAIVLNELAYTVAFLCDYYLFGQFMQTYSGLHDPIWFCRLRFLIYESSKVASLGLPALFALHEAVTHQRSASTSPLVAFLFRHRVSLVVDFIIICAVLATPIFFVLGQRHPSESCSFLFFKAEERAISIIGMICTKIRFGLLIVSLLTLWIVAIYLYVKATISASVPARLISFWSEQKLVNCLTIKNTLFVMPFAVMIEIRMLHINVPYWVEDICDMALLLNFIASAPIFLIIQPELRFWCKWRCCACAPISRALTNLATGSRRKLYQDQQQQQQQQQPTAGNEVERANI